jgi:hypothetical protein
MAYATLPRVAAAERQLKDQKGETRDDKAAEPGWDNPSDGGATILGKADQEVE